MNPTAYLSVLSVAERLKCNTRHSWTSSGRHESVAEHSWRLALMAMLAADEFPDLDMDRVIRMCIIHDLGEAFTGDIPAFDKTEADEQREDALLRQLIGTFPTPARQEFSDLLQEMDALQTREAKLYKALDKLEALIQHNESDIKTWIPLEYDLQMTYGNEQVKFSEYLTELRAKVREDSVQKIQKKH